MEARSEHVHIAYKFFAVFGADLYAQSVISNKNPASELRRKFIKGALLVGYTFSSHVHKTSIEHATSIHL